jgi:exopolysaccharide production protein ExoY
MTDFASSDFSPFVPARPVSIDPFGGGAKRSLDILLGLSLCILFSPLLLGTALLIKALDGGPVFFAHSRMGFGWMTFRCWKFRTMAPHTDEVLSEYLAKDTEAAAEWVQTHKLKHDPRVTRLGKILRESSVDELPQLLNVIKGDMSLVGPRPILPSEAVKYGWRLEKYAAARPGMTGLWQVSGRSELSFRRRIAIDSKYVRRYSFAGDLAILLRTFPAVISRNGSY